MRFLMFALSLGCQGAMAALPPEYQNQDDLNVIIEFIKEHPRVIGNLQRIEFAKFEVHFEKDCVLHFGRKALMTGSMPGPAAPLEFKRSTCPLD